MFIKKLQLKNFKRFTDLTIDLLPPCQNELQLPSSDTLKSGSLDNNQQAPKLVLLIGANGCGKSCVFDAFELSDHLDRFDKSKFIPEEHRHGGLRIAGEYFHKKSSEIPEIQINGSQEIFNPQISQLINKYKNLQSTTSEFITREGGLICPYKFYGRSAFRNVIDLNTKFNAKDYGERDVEKVIEKNLDRVVRSIDLDKRWDGDILYCFKEEIDRKKLTNLLNNSLDRIFKDNPTGHFQIESIRSEIGRSIELSLEVLIKKGNSTFPYEYLSAGEKQLFSILLNLHLRKKFIEDTIIYLDEIDLHLNTSIQKDLLKEITENLIPDNSQLWVASHSLGFIDYAKQSDNAAIIDFDNLDFDQEKTLYPESKNKFSIFEIAINQEFLSRILTGKKIVFAENQDTGYYNNLKLEDLVFFIANDKNDVFYKVKNHENYHGLIDRDYLSDDEINILQNSYTRLCVLNYYCFENYLFHPKNLLEYFKKQNIKFDSKDYERKILETKKKVIEEQGFEVALYKAREGYPFFKEGNEDSVKRRQVFQDNYKSVLDILHSDDFETFYKVFSMKKYCTDFPERQNLDKNKLAQTDWFKEQIAKLLSNK